MYSVSEKNHINKLDENVWLIIVLQVMEFSLDCLLAGCVGRTVDGAGVEGHHSHPSDRP